MTLGRFSRCHVARVAGVVLALGFLMSSRLNAQGSTGTILGTVTDSSGAVIPKAAVR